MNTFELGILRHGPEFTRVATAISTMPPYIDMLFPRAWEFSVKQALTYLDGKQDTPLWFWR